MTTTTASIRQTPLTPFTSFNAGMSLQALMALLGHVTPEMTMRYATLANATLRDAYDQAIARTPRTERPVVVDTRPAVADHAAWLAEEMLKTRLASGYCTRPQAAGACAYANICEQCDNFTTNPRFLLAIRDQHHDELALRDDATARGWDAETARHDRVARSLQGHIARLERHHASPPVS